MSTEALSSPSSGSGNLRQEALNFWRGRAARERQALAAGAVIVVLTLLWLALVQPAWRTVREAPAQLDRLDSELQRMQATSAEVRTLRGVAPVSSNQAGLALKAATDRLGSQARLSLQGDRASLTLTGVTSEALLTWLNEARSTARARPVEASLSRSGTGYSGTLVVTLGGAQ